MEAQRYLVRALRSRKRPRQVVGLEKAIWPHHYQSTPGRERRPGSCAVHYIVEAPLTEDVRRRLKWAMDWILRSVEQSDQDQKMGHLCTALGIMLLPGYKAGKKWELLCLRYRFLGGKLTPSALLGLYQMRLNLVHSSTLGVASPQETWTLRSVYDTIFRLILQKFKENPQTGSLEELMQRMETVDSLQGFLDQCDAGNFQGKGIKKLAKFVENRLDMASSLK